MVVLLCTSTSPSEAIAIKPLPPPPSSKATSVRWARLRTRAPILVEETVVDNAKTVDFASEAVDSDRLQQWLESLDPEEMGKYKM